MNDADRAAVHITAHLLDRGRSIDALASALTVIAALCVLLRAFVTPSVAAGPFTTWLILSIVAFGLFEKYLALRVAFDAALLRECAIGRILPEPFDQAMHALKLLPAAKLGRSWLERCAGARRLLGLQAMLLVAQVGAIACAVCTVIATNPP